MPMFRRFGRPGLLGLAARTAVVAGTATAVSGGLAARQRRRAEDQREAAQYESDNFPADDVTSVTAAPSLTPVDMVAELQSLAALHESGALNDQEFAVAKSHLLSTRP